MISATSAPLVIVVRRLPIGICCGDFVRSHAGPLIGRRGYVTPSSAGDADEVVALQRRVRFHEQGAKEWEVGFGVLVVRSAQDLKDSLGVGFSQLGMLHLPAQPLPGQTGAVARGCDKDLSGETPEGCFIFGRRRRLGGRSGRSAGVALSAWLKAARTRSCRLVGQLGMLYQRPLCPRDRGFEPG